MAQSPILPKNLVTILRQRAKNQPHKLAYAFLKNGETEELSLTYAQLDIHVRAIAAKLQTMCVARERILLLYPSGIEYIAAFFACLYAGMVAVPTYPPRRNRVDKRLQAIANDAQAMVILTTSEILAQKNQVLTYTPELAKLQWLATDTLADELSDSWQMPEINSDTLAFLQYTSGSTGTPKGVMVSHGNLMHNSAYTTSIWQYNSASTMVTWLPIFHDMGLIFGILQPLYQGFPCYIMSPAAFVQRPIRWLQAISHYKATHSGAPNFAYELCVNKITEEQRATLDLSSWEMSLNGAEPVRADTFKKFNDYFKPSGLKPTTLCHGYGLAEATLVIGGAKKPDLSVYYRIQNNAFEQNRVVAATNNDNAQVLVGCGNVATDAKVVIANPNTLTQCQSDEVGEIWFASPSVVHGYWQQPIETEETFKAYLADSGEGPFLRTGDLGFKRDDGELFVTGRLKDVIIIRGMNFYPQDIELTVEQCHPALRSSCGAAFSVEIDGEERLVVAQEVERTALKNLKTNEIISAIRRAISEQHDLQVYAILLLKTATIPKTSSGKIQRSACRAGFLESSLATIGSWQHYLEEKSVDLQYNDCCPTTVEKIQNWLLIQLAQKLNINAKEIDIMEPLANYGIDSLTAIQIKNSIKSNLSIEMSIGTFLNNVNISELAMQMISKRDTITQNQIEYAKTELVEVEI